MSARLLDEFRPHVPYTRFDGIEISLVLKIPDLGRHRRSRNDTHVYVNLVVPCRKEHVRSYRHSRGLASHLGQTIGEVLLVP